ncbi:MAG: hypothetical protein R3B13_01045 [Polyangiaceae bacterium]
MAGSGKDDDSESRVTGDREAILVRRKFFVASALAGLALTACDDKAGKPTVCLNVAEPVKDSGTAQPCLEPVPPPTASNTEEQAPSVCLKVAMPPEPSAGPAPTKPTVCLKVAPPPDEQDRDAQPRVCLRMAK